MNSCRKYRLIAWMDRKRSVFVVVGLLVAIWFGQVRAEETLRLFVLADAHVGWDGADQPTLIQQRDAVEHILKRFDRLDFLIDAGDAYHAQQSGVTCEVMRRDWMDVIANRAGAVPFLYAAGNHEVMHWTEWDPELQCATLGSIPIRPYYSVDRRGIHIVMLPELGMTTMVTAEAIEWLLLDMEVHKGQTTIIVSHNHISMTTGPDVQGYRGLVNSTEMREIFRQYPQVIAWIHGHNHDYQVLEKAGCLYVSAGRIGGFSKKRMLPLGGMYVEVTRDGISARGYDAGKKHFLTGRQGNINNAAAAGSLKRATTLDIYAASALSYGMGGAQDGQLAAVYTHYAGAKEQDIFFGGCQSAVLNENTDFRYYMERQTGGQVRRQLHGFDLPADLTYSMWEQGATGLTLKAREKAIDISIWNAARSISYFGAVPGREYAAGLEVSSIEGGEKLTVKFMQGQRMAPADMKDDYVCKPIVLEAGRHRYEFRYAMPEDVKGMIYSDRASDNFPTLLAEARFEELSKNITVHSFVLERADGSMDSVKPVVVIEGETYANDDTLEKGQLASVRLPSLPGGRFVVQSNVGGSRRVNWLIEAKGVDWQVRNATVTDKGKSLAVRGLRNPWAGNQVVFAPLFDVKEPYVVRLTNIEEAELFPLNRGNATLKVMVEKTWDEASVEIVSTSRPKEVNGAVSWLYANGMVVTKVRAGTTLEVK